MSKLSGSIRNISKKSNSRSSKSVKQTVQEYETLIKQAKEIDSQIEETDKKYQKLIQLPIKITKIDKTFKKTHCYGPGVLTRQSRAFWNNSIEMKGFKSYATMKITFKTPQGNIHYTNRLISLQQTADNNEQLMDDWVRWQINIIWTLSNIPLWKVRHTFNYQKN